MWNNEETGLEGTNGKATTEHPSLTRENGFNERGGNWRKDDLKLKNKRMVTTFASLSYSKYILINSYK